MQEDTFLLSVLAKFPNVEKTKVRFSTVAVNDLPFLKLCRLLAENGRVIEIDAEAQYAVVAIAASPTSLNEGVAAILLKNKILYIASYAKEGLIKQHSTEKNYSKINGARKIMQDTKTTPKNTLPITWIVVSILTMILLGAGVILMREIFPLQKASIAYNEAIVGYNANADTYNFLLKTTSIDNLDGFPIAADKLSSVDTTLSSVIRSFSNGNSAKKTQMDIRTIADLSDYLAENIRILEQITAPSEAWVAERLQNVDDILEIQAVTPDNDPNGLLNKEDGGYTACIYFTSAGINVDGDSPVSKGTDGGGAIEVYGTLEDAEARCEYLHGFDNTILYTGSYAIVGTMVIRISYIYTTEEQYEMTNRITKELTKLKKTGAE